MQLRVGDPALVQELLEFLHSRPDVVAEKITAHWRAGVKGFIVRFAEPFDDESIERLAKEVRPRLKELVSETPEPVSR